MDDFAHVPPEIRAKVSSDLLARITQDGSWDFAKFDTHNDYQRHLFSLFLKMAGFGEDEIKAHLLPTCDDIPLRKRESYLDDIVHSVLVGLPNERGELLPVYQEVR